MGKVGGIACEGRFCSRFTASVRALGSASGRTSLDAGVPAAGGEVDAAVCEEGDAFILEQGALGLGPSEREALGEAAVGEDGAVAGYLTGSRVGVERIAHMAGAPQPP